MSHREKIPTSSGPPEKTDASDNKIPKNPAQDEPRTADDSARKIDRPGFDLGGSSGDTHAGTGLGLGEVLSEELGLVS